ncbi:hypothetical protein HWD99_09555 [Microbacterium sp. C5A9]|nr:hypothetical protein [Microbacterium sp. C5A9]
MLDELVMYAQERGRPLKKRNVNVMLYRDRRVFLFVYSDCVNGPSVSLGLPKVVAALTDADALGSAILQGLRESNATVHPARDWRADPPDREFLEWLGLATYRQYQRGVRSVDVSAAFDHEPQEIEVVPERNERRGGFTPISQWRRMLTFESPEQLGRAVQEAMKKAIA